MVATKTSDETAQATIAGAHMRGINVTPADRKFPGYAFWGEKGAAVASAATLTLGDDGDFFHVTGTVTITDIDFTTPKDGRHAWLEFDDTLTLTHNGTTLNLPGGANIVTKAGDRALVVQDSGDNVHVLAYVRGGVPPAPGPHVIIEDQKSSGTNGGSFTTGAARTRDLNTEVYDPYGYCSISSNQFTLPAGTWAISWACPVFRAGYSKAWLYNVTAAADVAYSRPAYNDAASNAAGENIGSTVVTVSATTTFEIRQQGSLTRNTDGFGTAVSLGSVEVYTHVECTKLA